MRFGLIGETLGHSFSPLIFQELGYPEYELIPLKREVLQSFLKDAPFQGCNVTIPYKREAMTFCDFLSEETKEIGCVNAIVKEMDGTLQGHNTDGYGLISLLNRFDMKLKGKKVLILGGGGTSLTARFAAKRLGAGEVVFVSRKGPVCYEDLSKHDDAQVIINTTNVGMYPFNEGNLIHLDDFPNCQGVVDVIYNPLYTNLLLDAKKKGIPHAGGLFMLVAQGKKAAELFTKTDIPEEEMERIYRKIKEKCMNIVLIGMPGCGKSELGRCLANLGQKEWIDTDFLIQEEMGMSIHEIFRERGEAFFREIEKKVITAASKRTGVVISTGGGVVLKEENMHSLAQNGRTYFIDRDIRMLPTNSERPLSTDMETLKIMFRKRRFLYEKYSDQKIENKGAVKEVALKIWEDFHEATSD